MSWNLIVTVWKVFRDISLGVYLYRENLEYLKRIDYLGIGTLEQRRIRADLVLYVKLVSNETEIRVNDLFGNANWQRGHNSQLTTLYCSTEKRKLFSSNRLVRNWYWLTQDAVSSSSTSVFKRKLQDVNFNGRGSAYCFINACSPLRVCMLLCTTNNQ